MDTIKVPVTCDRRKSVSVTKVEIDNDTPMGVSLYSMKYITEGAKEKIVRRLKLLEGQMRGLQKLVESDTYCIDVITQTSAVKQGLSNVEDILLENYLAHCAVNQMKSGNIAKVNQEIIKVYKLKRK